MSQLAAANRRLIADSFLREGDNEHDVAMRFAAIAERLMPVIGETLAYVFELHLREQIRHDAFGADELSSGRAAAAEQATVCFADMVEFTRLGESLEPDELEGDAFPVLRAGVACGAAIPRAGDWYGRPVNVASRITALARPGSVLTDEAVHDALESGYEWVVRRIQAAQGHRRLDQALPCSPR